MRTYSLGGIEEIMLMNSHTCYGAFLYKLDNDWDFWRDVAKFCLKAEIDISVITEQLNFKILDR